MSSKTLALFLLIILSLCYCHAQTDSIITQLQNIPIKYLEATEKKISKYSIRITSKTEKTLVKLSRWENGTTGSGYYLGSQIWFWPMK